MNNPKVTIIVTVYNVEKYMDRCIQSVLCQTFKDYELLIIDDKTPDNSMQIAQRYADIDDRIRLVFNKENTGLMWARKVGYDNARGNFIVFLDSDDTLPVDAVELLYNAITKDSELDMVSGNIIYKKLDNSEQIWESKLKYGHDSLSVYKSLLKDEYRHNLCGHIIKKSLLTDYTYKSYKNFTKWEDFCLFYQLVANAKKIDHIDKSVYLYYQTQGSSTQVKISDRSLETTAIAHKDGLDAMANYPELTSLIYPKYQYCYCRLIHDGYKSFPDYLKQYDMINMISAKNIFKYNKLKTALKLLILKTI